MMPTTTTRRRAVLAPVRRNRLPTWLKAHVYAHGTVGRSASPTVFTRTLGPFTVFSNSCWMTAWGTGNERFDWLDHAGVAIVDGIEQYVSEPYHYEPDDAEQVAAFCDQFALVVDVTRPGLHHPRTVRLAFTPQEVRLGHPLRWHKAHGGGTTWSGNCPVCIRMFRGNRQVEVTDGRALDDRDEPLGSRRYLPTHGFTRRQHEVAR